MIVNLTDKGARFSRTIPIHTRRIGSMCDHDGANPMALVLDNAGQYHGAKDGYLIPLDQYAVAVALAVAIERDAPSHSGYKLRAVNLDDNTVRVLRNYAAGNLSAGIRKAALLIKP